MAGFSGQALGRLSRQKITGALGRNPAAGRPDPRPPAPQPVLAHEHASKAMLGAAITADLLDQGPAARLIVRAA